ncbi:unnamed protein product [Closterium sp. Yama58-4]|nr:unnamed protein product [Closterium sp. Yama58-4]
MVHYVDVNLPWNHSLCACCLSRILHPAPPITYQTSTLNALRLHLQQPVSEKINPCPASHNQPSQAILAYSATVRVPSAWSMTGPGVGRGGSSRTAIASAAARGGGGGGGGGISRFDVPSGPPAVQFKWKADFAPMPAAEGMFLEWMAEPRVGLLWDLDVVRCQLAQADIMGIRDLADASGAATTNAAGATAATAPKHFWWCCWQCRACWAAYRRCLAMVVFLVLIARFSRAVTLWRLHMRSCYNVFPALANLLNAGRQIEGLGGRQAERQASRQAGKGGGKGSGNAEEDCFGSILMQVLGVKGKKELESGFAAHVLPLLPGGRRAHGGMRARLPRIVTLWRLHIKSFNVAFPALANQLNARRQIGGVGGRQAERQASRQAGKGGGRQVGGEAEEDCFGSILVQVLGVKGKKELESGFAAHVLPLLPGGRRAHGGMRGGPGRGGGVGGGVGWEGEEEKWREGLRGVEWDEYVERMEEIISHGGLEAEQYRCSCRQCGGDSEDAGGSGDGAAGNGGGTASGMVITGVDPTDFALRAAFTLCMPRFAIYGVMAFTGACNNRYKDHVEDAAVEAARQRLAERLAERAERAEESGKGSVVGGGKDVSGEKKADDLDSEKLAAAAAAAAGGAAAAAVSSPSPCPAPPPRAAATSAASSAARLVPVISDPAVALFTLLVRFGAIPKPVGAENGLAGCGGGIQGWEEFPVGDREVLKAHGSGSALGGTEGIGGTGSFRDSVFDREEMLKEFNVGAAQGRQENGAVRTAAITSAAEGLQEYRAAKALSDSSTVTPAFPTLADRVEEFLRRFSPKRLAKEGRGGPLARAISDWPMLRSPQEVDAFVEFMTAMTTLTPACNHCVHCLNVFNQAVTPAAIVASFAFRPSSVLLRCFLSVYCRHASQRRELIDTLGIPPLPDLLPDRLVAPLLEGVVEHKRLHFLYTAAMLLYWLNGEMQIMEMSKPDGARRTEDELRQLEGSGWEGKEEWLIWEEVDTWRNALFRSWPLFELSREAALSWAWTGEEERARDWCVEIRQKERGCEKISRWKEGILVEKMLAAAGGGSAAAGGESEVVGGLKIAPAYLVPWVGGVNPFACLREMLLGETCYWELSNGRRVGLGCDLPEGPLESAQAAVPAQVIARLP